MPKATPNPSSATAIAKTEQNAGYKDGSALVNHMMSAHNGKLSKGCNGCKELLKKQKEARKNA
jgi:hypothetical protein